MACYLKLGVLCLGGICIETGWYEYLYGCPPAAPLTGEARGDGADCASRFGQQCGKAPSRRPARGRRRRKKDGERACVGLVLSFGNAVRHEKSSQASMNGVDLSLLCHLTAYNVTNVMDSVPESEDGPRRFLAQNTLHGDRLAGYTHSPHHKYNVLTQHALSPLSVFLRSSTLSRPEGTTN